MRKGFYWKARKYPLRDAREVQCERYFCFAGFGFLGYRTNYRVILQLITR